MDGSECFCRSKPVQRRGDGVITNLRLSSGVGEVSGPKFKR